MVTAAINNFSSLLQGSRLTRTLIRFSIVSLLAIWIIGFLTPVVLKIDNLIIKFFITRIYSNLCHQEAEKCIAINNDSMLVCARCAGIYFGAFLAGLVSLLNKSNEIDLKTIVIMILPLFMDVFFVTTGIYSYSKIIAFITGLVFGSMIYLIGISEIEKFFSNKKVRGNE